MTNQKKSERHWCSEDCEHCAPQKEESQPEWSDELFELSEKYCDHEKLQGDCLYHIFEPFIRQTLSTQRKEIIEEILEKTYVGGVGGGTGEWTKGYFDGYDSVRDIINKLKDEK